ncbi:hypothetical protein HCG49_10550 [Arenibacter sp. 6A1]|uniref:hypothetical protein n=1 Tax=Arenibacter sp. 6A1 TaxID=2720391 RepID=UPI0014484318|nr:hypothetical protein [Arenibacter sp. 6A1]NKI27001.1 hypothetical protein [Arenibacter sp. 6A1]
MKKIKLVCFLAVTLSAFNMKAQTAPTITETVDGVFTSAPVGHALSIAVPDLALLNIMTIDGTIANGEGVDYNIANLLSANSGLVAGDFDLDLIPSKTFWLNYTSVIGTVIEGIVGTRTINVELAGDLPTGMDLQITPTTAANGNGALGTAVSTAVKLGTSIAENVPTPLVTGIGSGFTGTGTNGVKLTYSLVFDAEADFTDFKAGTYSPTITYTLSDWDDLVPVP